MKRSPLKRKSKSSKHLAWTYFSKFIRQRDADENGMVSCFTCGAVKHWKEMDAGHYVPASVSLALRLHEKNVHAQCTACNRFRHGNLTQYALALKKKYDEFILETFETIRCNSQGFRYSESDYREIAERYKNLVKG